jgi:hypothetical protein
MRHTEDLEDFASFIFYSSETLCGSELDAQDGPRQDAYFRNYSREREVPSSLVPVDWGRVYQRGFQVVL